MIRLEKISKRYPTRQGQVPIFTDVDLQVDRGERLGILGHNGAGKSTLIRLISGVEQPTSGRIYRDMSISWPLAFGGAFLGVLSGLDNYRFVCRLYNIDPDEKIDFVEDFCELGRYFREPLRTYSAGMRARLAFAISMVVEFDCFLIDEIVAVGDARFQAKCNDELFERRGDRAFVIVSHHADFIREHCNRAAVLMNGRLHHYASVDEAYEAYNEHITGKMLHGSDIENGTVPSPKNLPEKNREEAMMEQQISGLGNIVTTALERRLDDDMLVELMRAFTNDSMEPELFLGTVDHLRVNGNIPAAIKFAELSVTFSANSLYLVVLGDLFYIQNNDKRAIDSFTQALSYDDNSFWAHRNLGLTYFKIGCYQECLPHFKAAYALTDDMSQQRELTWHIIDSQTYLEQEISADVQEMAIIGKTDLVELTPRYIHDAGLLNVRVQGLLEPGLKREDVIFELAVGDQLYSPVDISHASNSLRRYAKVADGVSFQASFSILLPDAPRSCSVTAKRGSTIVLQRASDVIQDWRTVDKEGDDGASHAELADRFFLAHDHELACSFYSLAKANDQAIDDERFVESLIALGRFNEAEWHLQGIFANSGGHDLLNERGGKLFDLYCSEIARSRDVNWEQKLSGLIADRLARAPNETAGLTNLGHLHVHQGRVSEAVEDYTGACEHSGDRELIHFARGITSARFANIDVDQEPFGAGAVPDRDHIVHLFSCDAKYFKRYATAVVSSSARAPGSENVFIHAHIVDPDPEAMDLARALHAKYNLQVTSEFFPFPRAPLHARIAYYTSARFINAYAIMQYYNAPVLITETDCQINWNWNEIRAWCSRADFGSVQSSLWNWVPWTKIPAGIVYFDDNQKGLAIADYIREFLMRVFADPKATASDLWTIDQVALWLAWARYGDRITARHLPMTSVLTLATGDKTNILPPVE